MHKSAWVFVLLLQSWAFLKNVTAQNFELVIQNSTVISKNNEYCDRFDIQFHESYGVNGTFRLVKSFSSTPNVIVETKQLVDGQNFETYLAPQAVRLCELLTQNACGNLQCPILEGLDYHVCNILPELPSYTEFGHYLVNLQIMDGRNEVAFIRVFAAIKPLVAAETTTDTMGIYPFTSTTERSEQIYSFELELPLRQNSNI